MGTRRISNPRRQVAQKPAPKTTQVESPVEKQPPAELPDLNAPPGWYFCACGCGKKTRKTYCRGHYPRTNGKKTKLITTPKPFTIARLPRGDGFGFYVCGNCEWFLKARPLTTKDGCQNLEVNEASRPCQIHSHGHGYFKPLHIPKVVEDVDLSEMDLGDLMIHQWVARMEMTTVMEKNISKFRIGDRVKFPLNGQWHRGAVDRLTKRCVIVTDDNGSQATLHSHEVELDTDPPASAQ